MHTIGNCFLCDLVKLIGLTLLFIGVTPHPRSRTKESLNLKTSMGNLLTQINITLDALNVKHHCENNYKLHQPGIKRLAPIKPLYKRSKTSLDILSFLKDYEYALTAYKNTFQHVINKNPSETHVPRRAELKTIIVDTSLILREWNALFYDTRLTPNSEHKTNLCPRKNPSGSYLCLCVSAQIDRYHRFLVEMYRRLRKISIKRLRGILDVLDKSTGTADKFLYSRRFLT